MSTCCCARARKLLLLLPLWHSCCHALWPSSTPLSLLSPYTLQLCRLFIHSFVVAIVCLHPPTHTYTTIYESHIGSGFCMCERIPFHFFHASSFYLLLLLLLSASFVQLFIPFDSRSFARFLARSLVRPLVHVLNTYFCHPYLLRDVTCSTITLSGPSPRPCLCPWLGLPAESFTRSHSSFPIAGLCLKQPEDLL